MAGWGVCRRCSARIWWGSNPDGSGRAFPFDDQDEQQSHFATCRAQKWVTDLKGERHSVSTCRACGAEVWWDSTFRGRRRPMDIEGDVASQTCHFDTCAGEPPSEAYDRPAAAYVADQSDVALWLGELGLPLTADMDQVTRQFRKLAMRHHPDMGGDASEFIRIKLAYDRLRDLIEVPV